MDNTIKIEEIQSVDKYPPKIKTAGFLQETLQESFFQHSKSRSL